MLHESSPLRRAWQGSRVRALGRRAILEVMARRPMTPQGVSHLYLHAIDDEEVGAFERFVDELRAIGPVVGLEEALARDARRDSEPCFTLSFDDGFLDNYTNVAKVLSARGISATVFVIGDFLGLSGEALADFTQRRLESRRLRKPLTHDSLKRMRDLGMRIGSHTMSHRRLTELSEDEARRELVASRELLASILGEPVPWFSWPFGKIGHPHLLRKAGYTHGFSIASRLSRDGLPEGVYPRRHIDLRWGRTICRYFALHG